MLANQSDAALRKVSDRIYAADGSPLPANHVFAVGDFKIIQPDGTIANATNLPTPTANSLIPGLFDFQLEQNEIQQVGIQHLQIHGAAYLDWDYVNELDGYVVVAGSGATPPGNIRSASDIFESIRIEGAYENSADITDTVLMDYVNKALIRGRELIVSAWRDYFTVPGPTFTVVAGTGAYALPSDFAQLRKVEIALDGSGTQWRQLHPMDLADSTRHQRSSSRRYRYWLSGQTNQLTLAPVPGASTDKIRIWYIPRAPQFVNVTDTITIQVDAEFELYVSLGLRKCKLREDLDTREIDATINDCVARLKTMADQRDSSEPFYLGDHTGDDCEVDW